MVICKFYLQGTCRFGNTCKFEHANPSDHNYPTNTSVLLQNYANPITKPTATPDTATLIKSVQLDMNSTEKGGQWLLSSYAPFKDKTLFPGFEDHSMEEIRFGFYTAAKAGTLDAFKQNLQAMLQQAAVRVKALQNPSAEAVALLVQIYNQPPQNGGAPAVKTTFAQPAPAASIFGGQSAAFASAAPAAGQGGFGAWGHSPAPTNASIFGQAQVFAPPQPKQANIFANQGSFQAAQQAPAFQQAQQAPAFQQAQQSSTFQHSASIFGTQPVPAAAPAVIDEDFYSKLEELSEDELKWFGGNEVDIMKISEKPPTREMCLKG